MIDRPEGNRNRKPIPRQAVANLGKQRTFTNEFNYREMIGRQPIPFSRGTETRRFRTNYRRIKE